VFTLNFDAMFDAYIAANQKTWAHDRSSTVGASEIFDCLRKVGAGKRYKEWGLTPDEDFTENWGATERGNIIENNFVVPALTTQVPEGVTLQYAGGEQFTLVKDKNSATPDGLFTGLPAGHLQIIAGGKVIDIPDFTEGCLGLEIKSIDPRAILQEERAKHFGQTQVGLGLTRELTEWKPRHWLILYVDASFLNKFTPFLVTYDEKIFRAAQLRAPKIWAAKKLHDLPAEGKLDGGCDHCKWRKACGEAIVTEIGKTLDKQMKDPESIAAVENEVADYLDAKAVLAAAEKEFARTAQVVKDKLLARKIRKVKSDQWSVTWFPQNGKKSLDVKKMIADYGIDETEYEKIGAPFDVLKVTPKGKNDDE
jgi:hypothetical protein